MDPSAASFLECIRRRGRYRAIPAVNQVADGIRRVGRELRAGRVLISASCADAIREFGEYRWAQGKGRDQPVKEQDHAMDDIRYFVSTVACREEEGFWARSVSRKKESGI